MQFFQYTLRIMSLMFHDLSWQMPECILASVLKGLLVICSSE